LAGLFGIKIRYSPLNASFLLAIAASFFVWFLVWKTKWGYEMRAVGHNTQAAIYAGISPYKNIIIAMCNLRRFGGITEALMKFLVCITK
jgi:simple sugar transport system permease protein